LTTSGDGQRLGRSRAGDGDEHADGTHGQRDTLLLKCRAHSIADTSMFGAVCEAHTAHICIESAS
jgi:hypothetical protein